MSFFGAAFPAKKPDIRTVTTKVSTQATTKVTTKVTTKIGRSVPVKSVAKSVSTKPARPAPPADRFKPSQRTVPPKKSTTLQPPKPTSRKRKASTPPPQFDSDSSDDDQSDSSFDVSRRRVRSSASSVDPNRRIGDVANRSAKDGGKFPLIHGADLTSGDNRSAFKPAFARSEAAQVLLQYPSASQRERFELVLPHESDGYQPFDDITETIKCVCLNYLPEELVKKYTEEDEGLERRITRTLKHGTLDDFRTAIADYNTLIRGAVKDGSISKHLSAQHSLDLGWVQRILDQTYARTVSPQVEILKAYENGTDFVYGELLPPLVSEIFRETNLRSDQVFVDLGSGVGNVVLQAALEVGCESWGCEIMKNPGRLAKLQAREFPARVRMWGLSVGAVHLINDDFLTNPELTDVLKRADVVLVNNQAFGPDLNSSLRDKFLDLKDGCQVVSLRSFKPENYDISERNMYDTAHQLVHVRKREYFSNSVSWADRGGNYYIARKDAKEQRAFIERAEGRRSRR